MSELLKQLLEECRLAGYTEVDIKPGICPEVIVEPYIVNEDGWPFIWQIVKNVGIQWGCGGSKFSQYDQNKLAEDGHFELKNNEWMRR
jgi:hypothetical protein